MLLCVAIFSKRTLWYLKDAFGLQIHKHNISNTDFIPCFFLQYTVPTLKFHINTQFSLACFKWHTKCLASVAAEKTYNNVVVTP